MQVQLIVQDEGLFIKGCEHNERLMPIHSSNLLAHDVVDHPFFPQGTAADEFLALGVVLHGRANFTDIKLRGDIESCWEDMENYDEQLPETQPDPDTELNETILFHIPPCDDPELVRLTVNLIAQGYRLGEKLWPNSLDHFDTFAHISQLEFPELLHEGQMFTLTYDDQKAILTTDAQ